MPSDFPFVKIPSDQLHHFGKRDPETRVYRREGTQEECAEWFDKVMELAGHAVSPGGVCMYAHVSRAAVYKAINEGRLTAFGFHLVTESRSVFGFKRKIRENPYVYVPVSEAKAWGDIISEKVKARTLTRDEEPGWIDDRAFQKLTAGMEKGKYPRRKTTTQK